MENKMNEEFMEETRKVLMRMLKLVPDRVGEKTESQKKAALAMRAVHDLEKDFRRCLECFNDVFAMYGEKADSVHEEYEEPVAEEPTPEEPKKEKGGEFCERHRRDWETFKINEAVEMMKQSEATHLKTLHEVMETLGEEAYLEARARMTRDAFQQRVHERPK